MAIHDLKDLPGKFKNPISLTGMPGDSGGSPGDRAKPSNYGPKESTQITIIF